MILIIILLFGFWCMKIAEKNGRKKGRAFVLGMLFGLFSVIGYYMAGKKTA